MKHAGIITFLHNGNYGSLLQAYALERVLEEMGTDCEHIDYIPDSGEKVRNMIRSRNHPGLILDGILKRHAGNGQGVLEMKGKELERFRKTSLRLTPPVHRLRDLPGLCRNRDGLVSGSDQIWSPVWLNPAYFFDFPTHLPRIAYACSLGVSQMPGHYKAAELTRLIRPYRRVSVREDAGAAILKQLLGHEVDVTPDPVALLKREDWDAFAHPSMKPGRLVCYLIGRRDDDAETLRNLSESLNMDPCVLPAGASSLQLPFPVTEDLSAEGFVGALRDAGHVLTDSFHGALFCCLFGTPFTLIRRYRDTDPKSGNSRVDQLISRVRPQVTPQGCRTDQEGMARLSEIRRTGLEWLRSALEET